MDFRRSGQLDERRRRVLMDEIASPSDADNADPAVAAASSTKGPVRAYGAAVLSDCQPRLTDLVPVRPFVVTVFVLLALTGVATVETIHIYAATTPLAVGSEQLAALDVGQRGSLAAWYSSTLLALAAVTALVTYGIRVHRVDDYRGRYRIWLWTAAALAFVSLDAATGLHDALALGITLLAGKPATGASLAAACTLTWLALYGLVLGTLAIRLAIEIYPSLPSFASLATAGLLYFLASLGQLEMLPAASPLAADVVGSTFALLAHLGLLASIGLYARHVHLDAQGRLKVHIDPDKNRKAKAKPRAKLKVVKDDASDNKYPTKSAATKLSEPARFGVAASTKASAAISKTASSSDYDDEDDDEDSYGDERLSKSERRRLKKLARRDQTRRAA